MDKLQNIKFLLKNYGRLTFNQQRTCQNGVQRLLSHPVHLKRCISDSRIPREIQVCKRSTLKVCTVHYSTESELSPGEYEEIADETLDSLTEAFEDLPERLECDPEYDVAYSSGVLTVKVSPEWGTYVINKQSPNKQIWFSSPKSGPKRFDYIGGKWIYKNSGEILHQLLNDEVSKAIGHSVDFTKCSYGKR